MISIFIPRAAVFIGYGILFVLVDDGSAQSQSLGQSPSQGQKSADYGNSNLDDYVSSSGAGQTATQSNGSGSWTPGGKLNPSPLRTPGGVTLFWSDPCLRFRENFRPINVFRRQRCRIAAMQLNNLPARNTQKCPRIVSGQCVPFTQKMKGACHAVVRQGKKSYTFVLLSDCITGSGTGGTGQQGALSQQPSAQGQQPSAQSQQLTPQNQPVATATG